MKTLVLPDTHGKSVWKLLTHLEQSDRVVFLGDYFDCYEEFTTAEQIANFNEIIYYKKTSGVEVIMLVGNHDYHYFPEIGYTGTSGYQSRGHIAIEGAITEHREHLQMCYIMGEFLFTHAGVSEEWLKDFIPDWKIDTLEEQINELFKHKPQSFNFNGWDPYGDNVEQTPIWIRPKSLIIANRQSEIKKKYIQIVGHTKVTMIDKEGKATGGRYFLVDTLDTCQEYITIEDGIINFKKV